MAKVTFLKGLADDLSKLTKKDGQVILTYKNQDLESGKLYFVQEDGNLLALSGEAKSIIEQNNLNVTKLWVGTKEEYQNILHDDYTIYVTTDESEEGSSATDAFIGFSWTRDNDNNIVCNAVPQAGNSTPVFKFIVRRKS